ncbi:MAG: histidinol dehydrogenase [Spirochaetales bacterium]|nr:histidinol dehydrogenase [Spirochaetales bacterium]
MLRIAHYEALSPEERKQLLIRTSSQDMQATKIAQEIIDEVSRGGSAAVIDITERIDNIRTDLLVSAREWERPSSLSAEEKAAFEQAKENITKFHQLQKDNLPAAETTIAGTKLGYRYSPVEHAALYVPGGKARYPSTVLMGLIPAALAGVPQMTIVTPANPQGSVDDSVLYCARLLGCRQIIKHGGAQGLAAAALGLAFPSASLIIGPGNRYATAAKQILSARGLIRQDQPAGPSEVVVLADDSADPEFVAADMLSQAEHGSDSPALLLTTSASLARRTAEAIERGLTLRPDRRDLKETSIREHSIALIFRSIEEAIAFSNEYAPEHLEICTRTPEEHFQTITAAGSVFLGHYAPVALGDYFSGTNHILPTGGAARSTSGVGVDTFLKRITYQYPTEQSLQKALDPILLMSKLEGLEQEHGNSVAVRVRQK